VWDIHVPGTSPVILGDRPFPARLRDRLASDDPDRTIRQWEFVGVDHDLDEEVVAVGRGKTDFEIARGGLAAWKQFDIGWVETFPRHAPVAVGTVVAVLISHLGFWSLNGCRVVYHVGGLNDDGRFYGTLTNQPRGVW
jgi:uncharacterized protein (UPF0548 family)